MDFSSAFVLFVIMVKLPTKQIAKQIPKARFLNIAPQITIMRIKNPVCDIVIPRIFFVFTLVMILS